MHCSGLHLNPKAAATELARQRVASRESECPNSRGIRRCPLLELIYPGKQQATSSAQIANDKRSLVPLPYQNPSPTASRTPSRTPFLTPSRTPSLTPSLTLSVTESKRLGPFRSTAEQTNGVAIEHVFVERWK